MALINSKAVKDLIKANDRRAGASFMAALEAHIESKILAACRTHNGGKKTLDRTIASVVGIKVKGE